VEAIMRISRSWAATALLATVSASLLTGSSVSASEHKAAGHRTFTLIEELSAGYTQRIDLGNPGPSSGDLVVSQRPLFDTSGQEVGTLLIRAVVIRVFDGVDDLIALDTNNELKDGVILTQRAFRFSQLQSGVDIAIIGGTGAYARARGEVHARLIDSDTVQLNFDVWP
jgi:hypothetical protein